MVGYHTPTSYWKYDITLAKNITLDKLNCKANPILIAEKSALSDLLGVLVKNCGYAYIYSK